MATVHYKYGHVFFSNSKRKNIYTFLCSLFTLDIVQWKFVWKLGSIRGKQIEKQKRKYLHIHIQIPFTHGFAMQRNVTWRSVFIFSSFTECIFIDFLEFQHCIELNVHLIFEFKLKLKLWFLDLFNILHVETN